MATLRSGGRLVIELDDGYWVGLLSNSYEYEPEILAALDRLIDGNTYFIDAGANIGYWSLTYWQRAKSVVAVEANPVTFDRLMRNIELSDARVAARSAAVWDQEGVDMPLRIHRYRHAASTLRRGDADKPSISGWTDVEVRTTTLSSLIEAHCPDSSAKLVVKLDVEGAEIAAVQGGGRTLAQRNVTLLYEDHAKDPTHEVTRFLLDMGLHIFDPLTEARLDLSALDRIKTQTGRGYNFLARWPTGD